MAGLRILADLQPRAAGADRGLRRGRRGGQHGLDEQEILQRERPGAERAVAIRVRRRVPPDERTDRGKFAQGVEGRPLRPDIGRAVEHDRRAHRQRLARAERAACPLPRGQPLRRQRAGRVADERDPRGIDRVIGDHAVHQFARRGPVGKRTGPAAAVAHFAVIDVERGNAEVLPPGRERRHVGLVGDPRLPAAAVEDHRQRKRPLPFRQAQLGKAARVVGIAQHGVGPRRREVRVGAEPVAAGHRNGRAGRAAGGRLAPCRHQQCTCENGMPHTPSSRRSAWARASGVTSAPDSIRAISSCRSSWSSRRTEVFVTVPSLDLAIR